MGMKTYEVPVEGLVVNAILKPDVVGLDEIAVIAYGISRTKQFTGSLSTINSKQLERFHSSGFSGSIMGLSSGVFSSGESGQPGAENEIRIRGFNTFRDANPLIVLDGFPFDGKINSIPVSDIASLSILKDAPATALYGSRAANGVIIVTTKQGIPGTSGLDFRMSFGITERAVPDYEKVSASEYYELQWEGIRNSLVENGFSGDDAAKRASEQLVSVLGGYNAFDVPDGELIGSNGRMNPEGRLLWQDNWHNELINKGKRRELQLNAHGGTEKSTYFLSGSVLDEEGIIKASNLNRYAIRANVSSKLRFLTAGVNLAGSISEQNRPESLGSSLLNPFRFTGLIAPIYPIYLYDQNGLLQTNAEGGRLFDYGTDYGRSRPFASNLNLLGTIELDERLYKNNFFTIRSYIDFKLAEGIIFKSSVSADHYSFSGITHQNMQYGDGKNFNGRTTRQSDQTLSYTANQMIRINRVFGHHNLQALAAHENYNYKFNTLTATRSGFPFPGLVELDGAATGEGSGSYEDNYRLESYFGKIDYGFRNRFFASLNYRSDGNSRFADNVRWGNFWGTGFAWLLSEEDFLKNQTWLDVLKIKSSYGEQGNDKIGSFYGYQGLYQTGVNNLGFPGLLANRLSTPGLSWESLNSFNLGTEVVINNRLSLNLDYYIRQNKDLLFEKPLPPSTGFISVDANIARLSNTGVDLEITGIILDGSGLKWMVDLNLGHFKNVIKELPQEFIISGNKRWEEGRSIYEFWIEEYAGVNSETGKSQWYYDIPETDANGNPIYDNMGNPVYKKEKGITDSHTQADRYYAGSSIPDLFGGLNNTFSFYGFDLSVLVTFAIGGKVFDHPYQMLMHSGQYGYNFHTDIKERWSSENMNTNIPVVNGDQFANWRSTRFLADADYLKIRNISLGYQIPGAVASRLNLKRIMLNLKADNLMLVTSRKGLVPMQSFDGYVEPQYVPVRTISIGFDVYF